MLAYGVWPAMQQAPRKLKHILCLSCWKSIFDSPVPGERLANYRDVAVSKGRGLLWCWHCQRHVTP